MKLKKIFPLIVLLFAFTIGFSQEKSRKQIRKERQIEKERQTEHLINTKEFVFVAQRTSPQFFTNMDLTIIPNFIEFTPDFIRSEMPFFGRGFSGIGYGGDRGLKFKGKPNEFTIVKKRKTYEIEATVKDEHDVFKISLSVSFNGSATLSIISNNRSPMMYFGDISKIEDKR
jgi:hypothetical protein